MSESGSKRVSSVTLKYSGPNCQGPPVERPAAVAPRNYIKGSPYVAPRMYDVIDLWVR